jgi:hypothetical protein
VKTKEMYFLVLYMGASSEAASNITSILSENDKQAMNEALSIRLTTFMSMIDDVAACSVSARDARSMSPPAGLTECHTASGIEKRSHCVTDYSGPVEVVDGSVWETPELRAFRRFLLSD